jgi:hypothetical protein
MAIRSKRFPEYDLSLYVVSGPHSGEDAIRFVEGLGPADAMRWLTYFDPTVDLDDHDVASLPRLKRTIAAKLKELFGDEPRPRVIVCSSRAHEEFFLRFWKDYLIKGEVQPAKPIIRGSLVAAYDWLALPEAAREAVSREIEARALVR